MNASSIARTSPAPLKSAAHAAPSPAFSADAATGAGRDNSFSTLLSQSAARAANSASSRSALPAVHGAPAPEPQPVRAPQPAQAPRPSAAAANADKPASTSPPNAKPAEASDVQPAPASDAAGTADASTDGKPAAADKPAADDPADARADGKATISHAADASAADPKSMQARLRLAKQASDARAARGAADTARPELASDLLRGGKGLKGAGGKAVADAESSDAETTTGSVKDKSTGTDASPLADLHAWLAAHTLPPDASAAGKAAAANGKASSDAGDDAGLSALLGNPGLPGSQAMADDPRNAAVPSAAVEAVAGQLLAAMEEGVGKAMESFGKQLQAAASGVTGLEGVAGASSARPADALMNNPTTANADTPPPEFTLATPVDAPEFTQSLGVQVSLMARDGIGEAKLHLNPAEMGPIAINIVMDGSQAQVDFTAASAETRHVIEAGLPELASAMKEAGVTLSGGGVFDQSNSSSSGQPGRDASSDGQSSRAGLRMGSGGDVGATSGEAAAVVRRAATMSRGGVDTYA